MFVHVWLRSVFFFKYIVLTTHYVTFKEFSYGFSVAFSRHGRIFVFAVVINVLRELFI